MLGRDKFGKFKKGFHSNPDGQFKKGEIHYRHPKGYRSSPETEFRQGDVPSNFTGVGIPRLIHHGRDGDELQVTLNETVKKKAWGREYYGKRRTSYTRYVFGLEDIPDGYVVYAKDGNRLNTHRENLECISRGELMKRNHAKSLGRDVL